MWNLKLYLTADYNKDNLLNLRFSFRLADSRMLCWHIFAAYYYQIVVESPAFSVVSGPRKKVRQALTLIISRHGISVCSNKNNGVVRIPLCTATFMSIKSLLFEVEKTKFTVATNVPMFTINSTGHLLALNNHILRVIQRWIVRKKFFDNQKWLYECYRSQSYCHKYMPRSSLFFWLSWRKSWILFLWYVWSIGLGTCF